MYDFFVITERSSITTKFCLKSLLMLPACSQSSGSSLWGWGRSTNDVTKCSSIRCVQLLIFTREGQILNLILVISYSHCNSSVNLDSSLTDTSWDLPWRLFWFHERVFFIISVFEGWVVHRIHNYIILITLLVPIKYHYFEACEELKARPSYVKVQPPNYTMLHLSLSKLTMGELHIPI